MTKFFSADGLRLLIDLHADWPAGSEVQGQFAELERGQGQHLGQAWQARGQPAR